MKPSRGIGVEDHGTSEAEWASILDNAVPNQGDRQGRPGFEARAASDGPDLDCRNRTSEIPQPYLAASDDPTIPTVADASPLLPHEVKVSRVPSAPLVVAPAPISSSLDLQEKEAIVGIVGSSETATNTPGQLRRSVPSIVGIVGSRSSETDGSAVSEPDHPVEELSAGDAGTDHLPDVPPSVPDSCRFPSGERRDLPDRHATAPRHSSGHCSCPPDRDHHPPRSGLRRARRTLAPPELEGSSTRQWPSDFRLIVELKLEGGAVAYYLQTLDPIEPARTMAVLASFGGELGTGGQWTMLPVRLCVTLVVRHQVFMGDVLTVTAASVEPDATTEGDEHVRVTAA